MYRLPNKQKHSVIYRAIPKPNTLYSLELYSQIIDNDFKNTTFRNYWY